MNSLIRYAFHVNIGVPYLLTLPLAFFAPGPLALSLSIWAFMAIPLLVIAAALRRAEQRRGVIRPSTVDSRRRGLAQIPKTIGTAERPSVIGISERSPYTHCHVLAAVVGEQVHVMVISRWWPYRVRDILTFESLRDWRAWAKQLDVRFLPEGPYAESVYHRYFGPRLGAGE